MINLISKNIKWMWNANKSSWWAHKILENSSFSLNDICKISLKLRQLPQCILDVKAEIEEKEIPFGLHKQRIGERMSAAFH